jgi:hypothetical protein
MEDVLISLGVNAIVTIARDPKGRGKWRKALLKVFREIAKAFSADAEFQAVAESVVK